MPLLPEPLGRLASFGDSLKNSLGEVSAGVTQELRTRSCHTEEKLRRRGGEAAEVGGPPKYFPLRQIQHCVWNGVVVLRFLYLFQPVAVFSSIFFYPAAVVCYWS